MTFFRSPFACQPLPSYRVKQNQTILSVIQRGLMARHPRWLARQAEAYVLGGNLLAQTVDDFSHRLDLLWPKMVFARLVRTCQIFVPLFFNTIKSWKISNFNGFTHPFFIKKRLQKRLKMLQ